MPIIKHIQKQDYTIIDNTCLRDQNLDLDCRGLLITMLSLPDNWDFSGKGLSSILPCGESKVFRILNKLEKAGYLKRERVRNEKGRIVDTVYYIAATPMFKEESENETTSHPTTTEEINGTENSVEDCAEILTGTVSDYVLHNSENICTQPFCQKPKVDDPNLVEPEVNTPNLKNSDSNKIYNNKLNTNKLLYNQVYTNQSINQSNTQQGEYMSRRIDGKIDRPHTEKSAALFESYKTIIKQNIEYDILTNYGKSTDTEIVNEIVDIMAQVTAFGENPITINKDKVPAPMVQGRFMSLGQMEIEYVLESLRKNTTAIKNIRSYLITTLYNSKSTQNIYWQEQMQHDFYGGG